MRSGTFGTTTTTVLSLLVFTRTKVYCQTDGGAGAGGVSVLPIIDAAPCLYSTLILVGDFFPQPPTQEPTNNNIRPVVLLTVREIPQLFGTTDLSCATIKEKDKIKSRFRSLHKSCYYSPVFQQFHATNSAHLIWPTH